MNKQKHSIHIHGQTDRTTSIIVAAKFTSALIGESTLTQPICRSPSDTTDGHSHDRRHHHHQAHLTLFSRHHGSFKYGRTLPNERNRYPCREEKRLTVGRVKTFLRNEAQDYYVLLLFFVEWKSRHVMNTMSE